MEPEAQINLEGRHSNIYKELPDYVKNKGMSVNDGGDKNRSPWRKYVETNG